MATTPLTVSAVTKEFASVTAVDQLTFSIEAGEIFALLGPNGAGKSTTVRMLVGILRPDSGTIRFQLDGHGSHRAGPGLLGYLPEERGLYRDAPVARTLEHFGVLHGMDRLAARAAAHHGLEQFSLGDRATERVDALSKGNQQKVQFLAATLHRPRFAILDEPFSGLDPVNQQRFLDEIHRLREEGCTVLLSAHQMDLVETIADRVLLLDGGRAQLMGSLEEIRRETGSGARLRVELAEEPAADWTPPAGIADAITPQPLHREFRLEPDVDVGRVLHQLTATLRIRGVDTHQESLREIFLRSVGRTGEDE